MTMYPLSGLKDLHLILLCTETLGVVKGLHTHYQLYGNHQYGD
jgi:hypothetical protein